MITVQTHKSAGVAATVDPTAGTVTIEYSWLAPAGKRAASPHVVPIGAIESLDVDLGWNPHVRMVLRGGRANARKVADDLNAFTPITRKIEPWLDALRAAMAEAEPVYDFGPPPEAVSLAKIVEPARELRKPSAALLKSIEPEQPAPAAAAPRKRRRKSLLWELLDSSDQFN